MTKTIRISYIWYLISPISENLVSKALALSLQLHIQQLRHGGSDVAEADPGAQVNGLDPGARHDQGTYSRVWSVVAV